MGGQYKIRGLSGELELNETSWMQEVGAQWTDNGVPIH